MNLKVLLIDADTIFCDAVGLFLGHHYGIEAVTAHDPIEAVRRLDGQQFDLIVADYPVTELGPVEPPSRSWPAKLALCSALPNMESDLRRAAIFKNFQYMGFIPKAVGWSEVARSIAGMIGSKRYTESHA